MAGVDGCRAWAAAGYCLGMPIFREMKVSDIPDPVLPIVAHPHPPRRSMWRHFMMVLGVAIVLVYVALMINYAVVEDREQTARRQAVAAAAATEFNRGARWAVDAWAAEYPGGVRKTECVVINSWLVCTLWPTHGVPFRLDCVPTGCILPSVIPAR